MSTQLAVAKNAQNPKSFSSKYYRSKYNRKVGLITLILLPASLGFGLLLAFQAFFGFLALGLIILLSLLIYRPVVGYFLTIIVAASLELYPILDPVTPFTTLIYKSLSAFAGIPIPLSAFELLIVSTFGISWLKAFIRNEPFIQRGNTSRALGVFAFFCGVGFAYGVGRGGILNLGIFEMRGFIGTYLMFHLTCYHLKDFRHWKAFSWSWAVAVFILSIFTFVRYALKGKDPAYSDSLNGFNHSTAIFYLIMVFWLFCLITYGSWKGQRLVAFILLFPIFTAMLLSGRRVAFAAMIICLGFFGVILLTRKRKTAYIFAVCSIIVLVPYTVAFWNSDSIIAEPAQAIRSQISPKERDASSDLYRIIEKTNVHMTIRQTPIFGVGFGQPFYVFIPMIELDGFDQLSVFTPHANFLWVWLKTGAGGFAAFCFIIGLAMFQMAQVARYGKEGPEFSLTVLAGIFIVAMIVYCYVDIGLVDARLMTYFGVCLGIIDISYRTLAGRVKTRRIVRKAAKL